MGMEEGKKANKVAAAAALALLDTA